MSGYYFHPSKKRPDQLPEGVVVIGEIWHRGEIVGQSFIQEDGGHTLGVAVMGGGFSAVGTFDNMRAVYAELERRRVK